MKMPCPTSPILQSRVVLGSGVSWIIVAAAAVPLVSIDALAECRRYRVQSFDVTCSGFVYAHDVSDTGVMTGDYFCSLGPGFNAYSWDGATFLPVTVPAPFEESWGEAVNNLGQVVGEMMGNGTTCEAFIATRGVATLLRPPPGYMGGIVNSVNDSAVVVGRSFQGSLRAVRWVNGAGEALRLPMGPPSQALDVNERGQICGAMTTSGTPSISHAFLWDEGVVTDLGTIPNSIATAARAINNNTEIAGYGSISGSDSQGFIFRSFLWKDGAFTIIDPAPGYDSVQAFDLNDAGEIVGQCTAPGNVADAYVWRDGQMTFLKDALEPGANPTLGFIGGINNAGQIAITGKYGLETVAVLLTPVPPLVGDLTCDWEVDAADLAILLGAWGACPARSGPCATDLDGDGTVGGSDLAILLGAWSG